MKRISIYCLLILCVSLAASAQRTKQLTILHTSDTHSRIEPIDSHAADQYAGMGGVVRRATFLKDYRAKHPDVLLFDCGDISQGTPYYNLFQGEVEVKMMNLMGYDAMTIGNHEFDFGLDNMARLFRMADFPVVCANYDVTGTVLEGLVKPYVVLNRNGMKIGVFGLSPKMEGLVQADNVKVLCIMTQLLWHRKLPIVYGQKRGVMSLFVFPTSVFVLRMGFATRNWRRKPKALMSFWVGILIPLWRSLLFS